MSGKDVWEKNRPGVQQKDLSLPSLLSSLLLSVRCKQRDIEHRTEEEGRGGGEERRRGEKRGEGGEKRGEEGREEEKREDLFVEAGEREERR